MGDVEISPDDYVKERLDSQIDWYDRKSTQNQRWFKRLQLILIVSSTMIPLLSGYLEPDALNLRIIIGLLGLVVAVVTGVLSLYQFQENWLEYRTTCETLRHEKYLFFAKVAPYNEKNSFLILVERVESLISKENTNWKNYLKKSNEKDITPNNSVN